MRVKTIVKDLLLLFVGLSLGVAFADALRPATVVSAGTEAATVGTAAPAKDGLVAYYFHGTHRCPTCRTIETLAFDSLKTEIDRGRIQWRLIDYDQPRNKHFSEDFELYSPSLVLVQERQGQVARWKNLDRVWSLTDKPEKFADYVQAELTAFQESKP